jgi:hypothetical protein
MSGTDSRAGFMFDVDEMDQTPSVQKPETDPTDASRTTGKNTPVSFSTPDHNKMDHIAVDHNKMDQTPSEQKHETDPTDASRTTGKKTLVSFSTPDHNKMDANMIDHNADGEAVDAAAEVLRARIAAEAAREVVVRLMAQRKARQAEHQTDLEQHAKQVHYSIYNTRTSYRTHHIRVHHTVHIIYEYIIPYTSYTSTSYRTHHMRVHHTVHIIYEYIIPSTSYTSNQGVPIGNPHSGVLVTKSAFTYARKNIHSDGPRNK